LLVAEKLDPREVSVRYNLGRLWERLGRESEALKEYLAFLELTPDDPRAVDLFSDKGVTLTSEKDPYLLGLVQDQSGKSVRTPAEADAFAAYLLEKKSSTRTIKQDGGSKTAHAVTMDMVPNFSNKQAEKYRPQVSRFAEQYKVSPNLVFAIMRTESNFNPFAVSRKGAQGLMQLMPTTAANHAVWNSFDPEQNISGGVRYLRKLLNLFGGDLRLALAAYNAGENAVARYRGIPPYRETREYVRKVLWVYQSRNFDPPPLSAKKQKPSPAPRQVVYPDDRNDGTGAVYRTRSREGLVLYTNTPR